MSCRFLIIAVIALAAMTGCTLSPAGENAGPGYVSRVEDPQAKALYHYGLFRLLFAEGQQEEAVAALQEAIRLDPENEEIRFELAETYIEMEKIKQAVRTVEDILIRNPDSVKAHLRLANAYFNSRQPELAIPHFRKIIELDPGREEVRLHLAIALARSGELGQAIEELKELLRLFPDSQPGRLALARLYRETKLDALAIEQYRVLIRNHPELTQASLELGLLYEERRQWNDALSVFRAALAKDPLEFSLRHHLARVYVGMKRYADALNELQTIVELKPEDFDARRKIGLIYLEQEKWEKAITVFREILALQPELEPVRYYLGTALERKEQWAEALDAFAGIDADSPLYDDAVAHMSYIYVQTERATDAMALLENRLKQPEPRPQIFYYLAVLHLGAGDQAKALEVLNQGLEVYPEDADLLYEKGVTLERLGEKGPARDTMELVIAADPDHAEALNFLAYGMAEENRDLDQALAMAERAVSLKPAGHILDTLGWIYFRLGRLDEARKAIEEAKRLLPEDEVVQEHYGDVLQALGRTAAAREAYQKALELKSDNPALREKLQKLGHPE